MADHFDAPGFSSPRGDGRVDITDHYAFADPGDPGRVILILDVNPFAADTGFRPDALYQTTVYTEGDLSQALAFRYQFSALSPAGAQTAAVTMVAQNGKATTLFRAAPVSFGQAAAVTDGAHGIQFFAGIRSEPFFFDTQAWIAGFDFTDPGTDFFIAHNVYSIALAVPVSLLGGAGSQLAIAASTWIPSASGSGLEPADQMGKPLVNSFWNQGDDENTFNQTPPALQASTITMSGLTFAQSFQATLADDWGYTAHQAAAIANRFLLPDVLPFDTSRPARYPNGRALTDDVASYMLNLLTNGKHPTDNVPPHTDYLRQFPFLGTPH